MTPTRIALVLSLPLALGALGGCAKKGDLVLDSGVGVTALRSPCPRVGIPEYTGDITLFSAPGRTDADAIDVVASMTRLRSTCNDSAEKMYTEATFEVQARRTDTSAARRVELPYFVTVVRGGSAVLSKRVGTVSVDFAAGQERASASGRAGAFVDRAEATLPEDIRKKLTQKRKSGDESAAVDPLTQPDVRVALARASFELLVGFQLDQNQIAYNATR